jgi:putative tricarboxylic transport membrane protein
MVSWGIAGQPLRGGGVQPGPAQDDQEVITRRAMLIASGDIMVFVERPISAVLLACSALLLAALLVPEIRRKREVLRVE